MGNSNSYTQIDEEVKYDFQNSGKDVVAAKLKKLFDEWKNAPLNIAVTGETGSGKSSFINAIRFIKNNEEGAAPVGVTETTMEVTLYLHPNFGNVTLWDLPGVGSTNFPAAQYLEMVQFKKYDFFIIISAGRFTENDKWLAKEIQKMKKKFYFVRSKIDIDIRNAMEDQREFNLEETLTRIKNDCIIGLQRAGLESPQVFLVSNKELHLYDFLRLQETLERELPDFKRDAFLIAMPNISLEMINKKEKGFFRTKIKYIALLSLAGAAVPILGISAAVEVSVLVSVITWYVFGFGLDIKSLKRMANYSGVPYEELWAVITSPMAAAEITSDFVQNFLSQLGIPAALLLVEEGATFIPIFGIPVAMGLSYAFIYKSLNMILNKLAEDAEKVFQKVTALRPQGHNR